MDYKSGYFHIYSESKGNFLTVDNVITVHNSIEINSKVYYDVVESKFIPNRQIIGEPGISMQLYYNKTYGILQIIREGENFLTISQ